jgi:nucleoside-diphosphate-sugar epimerase
MKMLITGINGWVASALAARCRALGHVVRGSARQSGDPEVQSVGPINALTDWSEALVGCEAVLHVAARVHVMQETATDPLATFREVNVQGTLQLAQQAAAAGVRRFVFVSSIKVNGETTSPGRPFRHDDAPNPQDAYGISKREAEDGLRTLARRGGMEIVIVRPPLVYGPGVKANFAILMRAVRRGLPLPLALATHNRRSLVSLDNLIDLLITCTHHPAAAGQTFLVSDGEDLSTANLLHRLGCALGQPARLFPVPLRFIEGLGRAVGQQAMVDRLLGNLQVDLTHTTGILGWRPPLSVDEGLARATRFPKPR